ncbi:ATP-binding protein [Shewanella chilikensis]|uniref:ATP-binding protein n=1 Tax=Shewanella chilikensis TaxID=558541 RepID=UPI001F328E87|nr:ATP-binding protein [Shewanella chilikensis]MCE9786805.1 ATP-binding protein [Shewanella chilikensis]
MAAILVLYQNGQQERVYSDDFQRLKQQAAAIKLETELLLERAALNAQSQAVQLSSYLKRKGAEEAKLQYYLDEQLLLTPVFSRLLLFSEQGQILARTSIDNRGHSISPQALLAPIEIIQPGIEYTQSSLRQIKRELQTQADVEPSLLPQVALLAGGAASGRQISFLALIPHDASQTDSLAGDYSGVNETSLEAPASEKESVEQSSSPEPNHYYWLATLDNQIFESLLSAAVLRLQTAGFAGVALTLVDAEGKTLAHVGEEANKKPAKEYARLDVMPLSLVVNAQAPHGKGWQLSIAATPPRSANAALLPAALLATLLFLALAWLYVDLVRPLEKLARTLTALGDEQGMESFNLAVVSLPEMQGKISELREYLHNRLQHQQGIERQNQQLRLWQSSLELLPRALVITELDDSGTIIYASKNLSGICDFDSHSPPSSAVAFLGQDNSHGGFTSLPKRSSGSTVIRMPGNNGRFTKVCSYPLKDGDGEVQFRLLEFETITVAGGLASGVSMDSDSGRFFAVTQELNGVNAGNTALYSELFLLLKEERYIVEVSQSLAELLGYSQAQLRQMGVASISPFWTPGQHLPQLLILKHQDGRLLEFHLQWRASHGLTPTLHWLWLSPLVERPEHRTLQAQELGYRAAFLQASVGFARIGMDGEWLEVNDKFCDISGCNRERIARMDPELAINLKQFDGWMRFSEKMLNNELKFHGNEKRYVRLDDNVLWLNVSVCLIRDCREQPRYFLMAFEDISQHKQYEVGLMEAKQQREELLKGRDLASEAGGIGNWSWDIESGELSWDNRMRCIYGLNSEKLSFTDWRSRVHPEDIAYAEENVNACIKHKVPFRAEFRVINQRTGATHWVKAAGDTIRRNGVAVKLFGINQDITDEKMLQQSLARESAEANQASQAKSRFLAVMSHEIRTPMNGVVGMIDLLRDTGLSGEQQRMIGTIRDSAFSLLEIINDILDFSKIEAGKMELQIESVSLLPILETTIEVLWFNAASKNVFLNILPDLSLPALIRLDPVRIRQIVLNLVGNAIKFTHSNRQQGLVMLRTECRQSHDNHSEMILEVIDNGVGMTKAQLRQLFEPFTQADSSTTRKYGGTGLGLSITKSFVDLMGGKIEVESEPDAGSTFRIRLPCEAVDDHQETELQRYSELNIKLIICIENKQHLVTVLHLVEQLRLEYQCLNAGQLEGSLFEQACLAGAELLISDSYRSYKQYRSREEKLLPCGLLLLDEDSITSKVEAEKRVCMLSCHPLKPTAVLAALAMLTGQNPALWQMFSPSEPVRVGRSVSETDIAADAEFCILVAEDHQTNREVISLQLKKLGCRFELAEDGLVALEMWRTGRFTVLLTDCHMPGMDGFELTAEIRRLEQEQDLPHTLIIAVTADAMSGELQNCLAAGMDDYLAKPVEFKSLKSKLLAWHGQNQFRQNETVDESHSGDTEASLDLNKLAEILGTEDDEVIQSIVQYFLTSLERELPLLLEALEGREAQELRRRAHALKGAANSSGAVRLGKLFAELEHQAAEGQLTAPAQYRQQIEYEAALVKRAMPQS